MKKLLAIFIFSASVIAFITYKMGAFSDDSSSTTDVTYEQKITISDSLGADSLPIADTQIMETTTVTTEVSHMKLSTSKSIIVEDGRKKDITKKLISVDSFYLSEKDILMSSKSAMKISDFKFDSSFFKTIKEDSTR